MALSHFLRIRYKWYLCTVFLPLEMPATNIYQVSKKGSVLLCWVNSLSWASAGQMSCKVMQQCRTLKYCVSFSGVLLFGVLHGIYIYIYINLFNAHSKLSVFNLSVNVPACILLMLAIKHYHNADQVTMIFTSNKTLPQHKSHRTILHGSYGTSSVYWVLDAVSEDYIILEAQDCTLMAIVHSNRRGGGDALCWLQICNLTVQCHSIVEVHVYIYLYVTENEAVCTVTRSLY